MLVLTIKMVSCCNAGGDKFFTLLFLMNAMRSVQLILLSDDKANCTYSRRQTLASCRRRWACRPGKGDAVPSSASNSPEPAIEAQKTLPPNDGLYGVLHRQPMQLQPIHYQS